MVKRLFKWGLGVIVLVILVTCINWYQAKKSLVRYCRETTAGTSLISAKENARHYGFRFINYSSAGHKAYVVSNGVMGRYVCEIDHDGKRVVKTSMNFND